jgi:hypothetical protein
MRKSRTKFVCSKRLGNLTQIVQDVGSNLGQDPDTPKTKVMLRVTRLSLLSV